MDKNHITLGLGFIENPEDIYNVLKEQTFLALADIDELDGVKMKLLMKGNVLSFLQQQGEKINMEISALEKNSEWNTFTVAFYGETNAGKSTVIETLRILLGEQSKIAEIENFKKTNEILSNEKEKFYALENEIKEIDNQIEKNTLEIKILSDEFMSFESQANEAIENLNLKIQDIKKEWSFGQKIGYFLPVYFLKKSFLKS